MEKCIINYALPNEYIEIDPQKNYRYIMCLDDMLEIDKNYILANQIAGGYGPQNYFKSDNLKIKIYGENKLTLNEGNGAIISHKLDEERPDFMIK